MLDPCKLSWVKTKSRPIVWKYTNNTKCSKSLLSWRKRTLVSLSKHFLKDKVSVFEASTLPFTTSCLKGDGKELLVSESSSIDRLCIRADNYSTTYQNFRRRNYNGLSYQRIENVAGILQVLISDHTFEKSGFVHLQNPRNIPRMYWKSQQFNCFAISYSAKFSGWKYVFLKISRFLM